MNTIIIIGSGIAGLVAAIEAHNSISNANVLIVEKESKLGGNSLKATSGISICTRPSQLDSFINDTLSSGRGNPHLVNHLARKSMSVLSWLKQFDIHLPIVSQCGGHSICRTFTNEGNQNVGSYIIDKLLHYIQSNTNIQILTNARVVDIDESIVVLENDLQIPYNALILVQVVILVIKLYYHLDMQNYPQPMEILPLVMVYI
jgi:aspartate oxidase